MWRTKPIWMVRYHLSAAAINFALWVMPVRPYARDLRRRIHEFRDEATIKVLAHRLACEAEHVADGN